MFAILESEKTYKLSEKNTQVLTLAPHLKVNKVNLASALRKLSLNVKKIGVLNQNFKTKRRGKGFKYTEITRPKKFFITFNDSNLLDEEKLNTLNQTIFS